MTRRREIVVGIAWFRPEDWEELRRIAADADKLHDTHPEWLASAEARRRDLLREGCFVHKVIIDLKEWAAWSRKHDMPLDGASRSKYVAERVRATARHVGERASDRRPPMTDAATDRG